MFIFYLRGKLKKATCEGIINDSFFISPRTYEYSWIALLLFAEEHIAYADVVPIHALYFRRLFSGEKSTKNYTDAVTTNIPTPDNSLR